MPGILKHIIVAGIVLFCPYVPLAAASEKPHVVIILADDLGWNDVGYHGSEIRTPRLDALAEGGVVLDRFYAQPSCSPTRAALMTGESPMALGVLSPLSKLNPTGLPLGRQLMPEFFQAEGYQTLMVGKWHLGFRQEPYLPTSRGFEHFYGHVTGGIGYWDHVHGGALDWQRNGKTLREDGYSTHLMADEAVRLIQGRDRDKPMFLYASFNAPHLPNEAPEEAVERYIHIDDEQRRVHAAMVTELDTAIGRLIDALDAEGMLENTLVWFMSDNGGLNPSIASDNMLNIFTTLDGWFGDREIPIRILEFLRVNVLTGAADNSPFRKGKQTVYEGGVRVPSLVYWQGTLQPRNSESMITVQDVLPTLLAAVGTGDGQGRFDGSSQWTAITTGPGSDVPDYVIQARDGEAFYRYPWKFISLNSDTEELYNLESDPTEQHNVVDLNPDIVQELKAALVATPRGESVHVPIYRNLQDADFFGGEEEQPPWSDQTPVPGGIIEGRDRATIATYAFWGGILLVLVCLALLFSRARRKSR